MTAQSNDAKGKNARQRKLAVMAKCAEIAPDKKHPAHGFDYVSIQTVSNHLRKFCVDEGLDVALSISNGVVTLELVNADDPADTITSTWPVIAGDKGFAYSVKFPLMRTFLIGDGEENDEAEMANRSGAAASAASAAAVEQNGARVPPPRKPRVRVEWTTLERNCPDCGDGTLRVGVMPDGKSFIGCTNYPACKYTEQVPREGSAAVAAGGDVDPDSIPF